MEKEILYYHFQDGSEPFTKWLSNLKDRRAQALIRIRLNRLMVGNPGDSKSIGEGVFELRITNGPGYRVYFGNDGEKLVIILAGGDKSTQSRDIRRAKQFWADYRKGKND